MFLGTIDDNVRRYIAGNRAAFGGQEIVVGCSGNFTSEKVLLQEAQPAAVHSNDVSLYSLLLADAMLGQASALEVREPEYAWLEEYLFGASPWARPATVMLLLRLLKFEKRKTVYARRMWAHYREKFGELVGQSAASLAARSVAISSYYSGDVLEHFQRHGERDAIFTAYLPFFKGDYEHQYKRAQQIVGWPEPQYPMLDGERKDKVIRWMTEPGRRYLFLLNYPLEDVEPQMVSHKRRNTWVYLYTNAMQRLGLFRRRYGDTGKRFKLIEPSFRFGPGTRVEVVPVSAADVQHYKGLYLARNIDFTQAEQGFACLADGGVFGFIEMSRGKGTTAITFEDKHYNGAQFWYMLSDFPVEPKPHDKVSKLVVMLALTREMRRRLERTNLIRTAGVMTTARTEKPVSMKYRGPMKLAKRGEKDGEKYLNYIALWPQVTEQEAYREWWKRFGKN
jgi:hypothetical protein